MENILKSLLLTGIKHCGKSSTARLLSEHFSSVYHDIDDIAEQIFLEEYGKKLSSREIFSAYGRQTFQEMEHKASKRLLDTASKAPMAAAAGGGFCDNKPAVDTLMDKFIIIYIDEDADILYERIIKNGLPAFLSGESPYEDFLELYKKRTVKYNSICNIHISAGGRSVRKIADEIISKLTEEGYAG